jgi:hypothetical protein
MSVNPYTVWLRKADGLLTGVDQQRCVFIENSRLGPGKTAYSFALSRKCSTPCVLAITVTPRSETVNPRLRSNS